MNDTILQVEHLMMHFGGIKALNDVNLEVKRGSITALIGPNGAGKTTVFNCLTGFYRATGGAIRLDARSRITDVIQVLGQKLHPTDFLHPAALGSRLYYKMFGGTHLVNRAGLARTFQNIRLFKQLSVLDNVKVGLHNKHHNSTLSGVLRLPGYRKVEKEMDEQAMELLKVFNLEDVAHVAASNLPYGQQRRLEIARAMATEPKLLLLDEPAAGMNPNETGELMDMIRFVREKFHMTILLIEHDMKLVSGICEKLTVLNFGEVLCEGKTSDVLNDPQVVTAYLGE